MESTKTRATRVQRVDISITPHLPSVKPRLAKIGVYAKLRSQFLRDLRLRVTQGTRAKLLKDGGMPNYENLARAYLRPPGDARNAWEAGNLIIKRMQDKVQKAQLKDEYEEIEAMLVDELAHIIADLRTFINPTPENLRSSSAIVHTSSTSHAPQDNEDFDQEYSEEEATEEEENEERAEQAGDTDEDDDNEAGEGEEEDEDEDEEQEDDDEETSYREQDTDTNANATEATVASFKFLFAVHYDTLDEIVHKYHDTEDRLIEVTKGHGIADSLIEVHHRTLDGIVREFLEREDRLLELTRDHGDVVYQRLYRFAVDHRKYW